VTRDEAAGLAGRIKALTDPNRLEMLSILARTPGISATEIRARLGRLAQPTVSYHLSALRAAGLVIACDDGTPGRSVALRVDDDVAGDLAGAIRGLS
jgi:ArsR family transcriptional regulator, lead/cadmium/zinc/bismuth-responsive transcriptional repressor